MVFMKKVYINGMIAVPMYSFPPPTINDTTLWHSDKHFFPEESIFKNVFIKLLTIEKVLRIFFAFLNFAYLKGTNFRVY